MDVHDLITNAAVADRAMLIFRVHGLEYLPNDELFAYFAPVSSSCHQQARVELMRRCRERHPSLHAFNPTGVTLATWKHFELDEDQSRSIGTRWNLDDVKNIFTDVDVLMELSRGEIPLLHSTAPLAPSKEHVVECYLQFPHVRFEALIPVDTKLGRDKEDGGCNFWSHHFDCSVQQQALIKALHTTHNKENSISPFHAHVVLRRRSTGQMTTVLSTRYPNQVMGEEYGREVGDYVINFDTATAAGANREDILVCLDDFRVHCSPTIQKHSSRVEYSTSVNARYGSEVKQLKRPDHAEMHFKFVGCDLELDEEDVMEAFKSWRWG